MNNNMKKNISVFLTLVLFTMLAMPALATARTNNNRNNGRNNNGSSVGRVITGAIVGAVVGAAVSNWTNYRPYGYYGGFSVMGGGYGYRGTPFMGMAFSNRVNLVHGLMRDRDYAAYCGNYAEANRIDYLIRNLRNHMSISEWNYAISAYHAW